MRIIAFDLGRNMAWAHNQPKLSWGSRLYDGDRHYRLAAIAQHLPSILFHDNGFDVLVYETPFARGRDATRSLWGIAGILEAAAINAGMAVIDVAVPTIKKFACGDSRAPKNDMIKTARKFGYKGRDEHEADAICLLKYAEAYLERGRSVILANR